MACFNIIEQEAVLAQMAVQRVPSDDDLSSESDLEVPVVPAQLSSPSSGGWMMASLLEEDPNQPIQNARASRRPEEFRIGRDEERMPNARSRSRSSESVELADFEDEFDV